MRFWECARFYFAPKSWGTKWQGGRDAWSFRTLHELGFTNESAVGQGVEN